MPSAEEGGRSIAEMRAALDEAPRDHETRFALAQALLGAGEQAEAVDSLLLIIRREKTWNEGAARDLLLKLFETLGSDHELTVKGRRRLSNYMLN